MASTDLERCLALLTRAANQSISDAGDWLSLAPADSPLRAQLRRQADLCGKKLYFHEEPIPATTTFSLVHVDSLDPREVSLACERYYPRLSTPGMMVVEYYEAAGHQDILYAVHHFFDQKSECPTTLGSPQAFILK